jgi:hypothetical protein
MAAAKPKYVYRFGGGAAEGRADMKALLGGKGANLAEMANLGLPVPPGFTISTEVCTAYYANDCAFPEGLAAQVDEALAAVEAMVDAAFGDARNPLLVSVRSGARASMPGMMDTVLNLGLNDETVEGLAKKSGDRRFAYDSYRRFISMYSDVVLGVDHAEFEDILGGFKDQRGYELDTEVTAEDWHGLIARYKALVAEETGKPFPQDVRHSSGEPSVPCSRPGTVRAPSPTASSTIFRRTGAPPSTCRPWSSATWETRRPPASPSPAIPRPVLRSSMASSSSTPRARTWWPASARRRTSPSRRESRRAPTHPRWRR